MLVTLGCAHHVTFIIYSILLDSFCKSAFSKTDKPNYFTTKYNRQITILKFQFFLVLLTVGSGVLEQMQDGHITIFLTWEKIFYHQFYYKKILIN